MTAQRLQHTATLLPDGKVLVAGGTADDYYYYVDNGIEYSGATEWDTAELYDPVTGRWSVTGNMNASRHVHTATFLTNGKVLVVGGYSNGYWAKATEVYDVGLPVLTLNSR